MLNKLVFFLSGVFFLALVIWLGFKVGGNNVYVPLFGVASAILAPLGLAAISYALGGKTKDTLQNLEKVPQIADLIEEAKTQEEKIRLLEIQRQQLTLVIETEARRQSLLATKDSLEERGSRILKELDLVNEEVASIDNTISTSPFREEIVNLQNRLKSRSRGDIVLHIAGKYYVIDRDLVLALPMGRYILAYLRVIQMMPKYISSVLYKDENTEKIST